MADLAVLLGRFLIAALFAAGAAQKAVDPSAAMGLLAAKGLPQMMIWPALIYNAVAALALISGRSVPIAAASLAIYCMLTSLFHLQPDDPWQISIFVKNWAIAGGCLILAVHGPGRYILGGTHPRAER